MPKRLLNKSDLKPLPKGFKRVLVKRTFKVPALTLVMMMLALGFSLSDADVMAYAATSNYAITTSTSTVQATAPTFSEYWYQDSQGNWHIKDGNGNMVTNAWLCDDAVASNGQDIWYLIDSNGNMVSAGLVQDQTGNIYSLETSHNGYYGMLRYKSGAYDGVYLDLESSHMGSFANIKNQDGRSSLQAIYGLTQVNIDNSNCVYTSSFRNSYNGGSDSRYTSLNPYAPQGNTQNNKSNEYIDYSKMTPEEISERTGIHFTQEQLDELTEAMKGPMLPGFN